MQSSLKSAKKRGRNSFQKLTERTSTRRSIKAVMKCSRMSLSKLTSILASLFQISDSPLRDSMNIEVEFEGSRTTFKIVDGENNISKHEIKLNDRSSIGLTNRVSVETAMRRSTTIIRSKTFGEMKHIVAPFFSLSPDEFFFAVRMV